MKRAVPVMMVLTALAAAVACGSEGDDAPRFLGEGSGGRTSSGGASSSGGRASGGASSGGASSGGAQVDGGGGTSSGGTDGGGATGTGGVIVKPECHLSTTNEICDGCIHDGCATECVACEGNADCVAILDCMLGCTGNVVNCLNDCRAQYPDGSSAFTSVALDCGRARCSSFCPFIN